MTRESQLTLSPTQFIPAIYALLALVAFWGVHQIGMGMDDFLILSSISQPEVLRQMPFQIEYNRGMVHLLIMVVLFNLPVVVAVVLKAIIHWFNAVLLERVLRTFGLPLTMSIPAGAVFLVWHSNVEVLYWIVGGYSIYGVSLGLCGLLLIMHNKAVFGIPLGVMGMLSGEGVVLPLIFVVGVALLYQRASLVRLGLVIGGIGGLFAAYYLGVRHLLSPTSGFHQYTVTGSWARENFKGWMEMLFGLSTSQDAAWLWNHTLAYGFAMVLLPLIWLVLVGAMAIFLATGAIYIAEKYAGAGSALYGRRAFLAGVVCVLGISLSIVPYLLLTQQWMQTRYTYTAILFLSTLFGLLIGAFLHFQRLIARLVGVSILAMVLTVGIFFQWSAIQLNFKPAHVVSDLMVEDLKQTYADTGAKHIFLVNDPRSVGVGYSIARDWAYRAVGQMWLGKDVEVTAEMIPGRMMDGSLREGLPLVPEGETCVFLSWKDGQRVIASEAGWGLNGSILSCTQNRILPAGSATPTVVYEQTMDSQKALPDFCGDRCSFSELARSVLLSKPHVVTP
jgi:hypothetical protein